MPTYTDVFGGANIYPSEISYSALALSSDVVLSWPEETSTNTNLATRIIDVTETASGFSIFLPDAQKSGVGNTILFNNQGANTFIVKDADGGQTTAGADVNIAAEFFVFTRAHRYTFTADEHATVTGFGGANHEVRREPVQLKVRDLGSRITS